MQAFSNLVQRDACVFVVTQRKVEILETLCSSTLEEIIQPTLEIELDGLAGGELRIRGTYDHNGSFALAVDLESTNDPPVFVLVILEIRYTLEDLNELLPFVLLLVQLPDILSSDLSVERHAQHGLDPAKPRGNGWHERDFLAGSRWKERRKMPSSFAFVDVVRERVRSQTAVKALSRHLW